MGPNPIGSIPPTNNNNSSRVFQEEDRSLIVGSTIRLLRPRSKRILILTSPNLPGMSSFFFFPFLLFIFFLRGKGNEKSPLKLIFVFGGGSFLRYLAQQQPMYGQQMMPAVQPPNNTRRAGGGMNPYTILLPTYINQDSPHHITLTFFAPLSYLSLST
jgi:hypothetical protein